MAKSVWEKLKDALQLSESAHVESRRNVLKGAAGLALLAAIPVGVEQGYRLLTKAEQADLIHRIQSGQMIENQFFLLDRPVTLKGLDDLIIRNCSFVTSENFVGDYMMNLSDCKRCKIENCRFDNHSMMGSAIKVDSGERHNHVARFEA